MKKRIPEDVLKEIFQKRLERRDMSQDLYQRLRKMILSGKLKDGQRLVQEPLARQFDVSRQTVRNAFAQLKKDKLIKIHFRKGVFVSYKP
ncbi:MAG: GntR family transcriptional regulator [Syntrophaceae bacterium]|nr:GntR family transcriptional regulator [Syntrophaceae bacterium]